MAMNAVLAIIDDGGRVIVVFYTEGEEINSFLLFFIDSDKTFDGGPSNLLQRGSRGVGYVPPSKPWRWRGKRLHHGGDVCVLVFS
jgi:hypothetical protein